MPADQDFSLHKKVAIARSGVYRYHVSELASIDPSLIPVPDEYKNMTMFNVYRPAPVLDAAASMFASKPLVLGHTDMVHPANWRDLVVGYVGSSVQSKYDPALDEVVLDSEVTIGDQEAIMSFHEGVREVSPWYNASFSWRKTCTRDGTDCQIVMDRILEVNNVAMLSRGRGGRRIKVADSERSIAVSKKSSIFYSIAKKLGMVKDGEGFLAQFQGAVDKRKTLSVEELSTVRDGLSKVLDGLPDSENKELLSRCVFDLPSVKDAEDAVVSVYSEKVGKLFATLDAAADEENSKIDEATKKEAAKEGEDAEKEKKEKEAAAKDAEAKAAAEAAAQAGSSTSSSQAAAKDGEFSEADVKEYQEFLAFKAMKAATKEQMKGANVRDGEAAAKDGEVDIVDSVFASLKGKK